jgi:TolB-like protein
MDLVGYSKLLLDEQRQYMEQLTEIVRGTEQVRSAKEAGNLIRLPVGDGMALVFFDSPEAPVRCAIEISKTLKACPQLKLRMGIHSGPINEVRDVNDSANVAGAGINLAQRVMDCGDDGHILLSKRVAEDLGHSREWGPYLHDLGECAVKHGVPMFLVNFFADDVGNPELPKMIQQSQSEQVAKAAAGRAARKFRGMYLVIAATIFLLGVAALSIWLYSRQKSAAALPEEKSIAVLPFENFSPQKNNAFFADGIQDDILTTLAKIKDLRVISRSSVMGFRDAGAQNSRHIGRQLGVANVLEGSVRKEGDRVVVNVQLIDTQNNRQIWANRYDRTLVDSLGLQGELASEIADTLRATLSDDEKALAAVKPTHNADAYVFICARTRSLAIPIRCWRITRPPSSFTCRQLNSTRISRSLTRGSPLFVLKSSVIMNRPRVGGRKPVPKRKLRFDCNRILRKATSRSVSAFTGWIKTTIRLWSNSRSRLVYHRAMRIHAG